MYMFDICIYITYVYLFIIDFWLCWVLVDACGLFSSCREQGLLSTCDVQTSRGGGFSCCGSQALQHRFSSRGMRD